MNYDRDNFNSFLYIVMALYFETKNSLSHTTITGIIDKILE